jgi:hypothetical protein
MLILNFKQYSCTAFIHFYEPNCSQSINQSIKYMLLQVLLQACNTKSSQPRSTGCPNI